jgi:hypothetical protein
MHILVSVFLSHFWLSPAMTISFLPILLWETKLTFIWMASQTRTTAESGQLRTLWLFIRNHCILRVSQFGVRYAQQMWLVPASLRMKWAEHLRLQVTVTEQWSPHSWHLQWSAWRWIKNGAFGSNRMVQPATLQGNQWLASDNCSRTADFPIWRPSLATPVSRFGSSRFFYGATWRKGYTKQNPGPFRN